MTAEELDALPEGSVIVADSDRNPGRSSRVAVRSNRVRRPWYAAPGIGAQSTKELVAITEDWTVLRRGRP